MSDNCPNCGDSLPDRIAQMRMETCASCGSTVYINDDVLSAAGQAGEMFDAPMLFQVGKETRLDRMRLSVKGHVRYSYGRGWWDEFWCLNRKGKGVWVSVDEGDIVVQRPLLTSPPHDFRPDTRVGSLFEHDGEDFRVVERGEGTCVALRGQFCEIVTVGETYRYINAQGNLGTLLSCESATGENDYFAGEWFDPFEVGT